MFDASSVDAIRAIERRLDLSQRDARQQADRAVRKAAFEIEAGAKRRAPVDTGNLRNSINTTFEGDVYGTLTAKVGPEAFYGVFVEMGTARMAPQPYLGPAFDAVEPGFLAALRKIGPFGGIGGLPGA